MLKSSKREYSFNVLDNQGVEIVAEDIFRAFLQGLDDLHDYLPRIEAIGYDVFSPSLVFMDKDGEALYPILTHLDRRSRDQTKQICDVFGMDEYRNITGVLPFSGGVTITSILWMKQNMPQVFNKTYLLGHLNTYIYKKLTGIWSSDPVNASMMGLYNTVAQSGWSNEICKTFDISMSILPPINHAGSILGTLTPHMASITGLTCGIPVSVGSNDAATAQIAADNTKQGDILNISGSNEMVSIISETPCVNPNFYLRCAITPGKWQFYAITTGGFAIEWFRSNFCLDLSKKKFFDEYIPQVVEKGGLEHVSFIPHLAGDRQSLEKKYGAFEGLTLGTNRADMLYALLVGTHKPVVDTINISKNLICLNKTIKLTGGLINESYCKLKKRILPGFEFEVFEDGPIIGNVKLIKNYL